MLCIEVHLCSFEVHLVHWNEELFTTYDEAIKKDDAVVILAVFVQVNDT